VQTWRAHDLVDLRQGDAQDTLGAIAGPIDLLFLDGSNDLYVPVLQMLEDRLSSEAVIAADLSTGDPHHDRYRDYVYDPRNDYVTVEIPVDAGLVVSTRRRVHEGDDCGQTLMT
jgi:predicted O-methyltransferase YrrM